MGWMDGLVAVPGANIRNLGNLKQNGRLHYTAGVDDSTGIGINGYFHFLIPKDGTPKQFAPTEAICWDACEWNPTGVGIEFERLSADEPLTDSQISWGGKIIQWLHATDGIPLTFRDSPQDRMPVGTLYQGFTTHRSLHEVQCDEHYDYVTQADWDRMVPAVPPPEPRRKRVNAMYLAARASDPAKPLYFCVPGDRSRSWINVLAVRDALLKHPDCINVGDVPDDFFEYHFPNLIGDGWHGK